MFQNLDPEILRDRYAVYVDNLSISGKTAQDILDNVEGVANVRVTKTSRAALSRCEMLRA